MRIISQRIIVQLILKQEIHQEMADLQVRKNEEIGSASPGES